MKRIEKQFDSWSKRMKGNKIRAICKPCWELLYCPYGVLVEEFHISKDDDYLCRIYGHECPVFTVAEPFTETKKLRNINRNISREVLLKVYSRDKQICQICNITIPYDEIEYDHIIPWSKGGGSNESNIRLVCSSCNKKRGNQFEDDFLVSRINGHDNKFHELNLDMLNDLFQLMVVWSNYHLKADRSPTMEEFCSIIKGEDEETDKFMFSLINSIYELITSDFLKVKKKTKLLLYRWSLLDGKQHSVNETCSKYKVEKEYYVKCESLLLERLGFRIIKKEINCKNYYDMNVDE